MWAMQPSASPGRPRRTPASRVARAAHVRRPRARLREPEVAELVALGVLLAGVLAGEEQLAALVEEVADVDHLLDREARRAGAGGLAGQAGEVVVARVPDHRVVVAEHAERGRASRLPRGRRRRCRSRRRSRRARRCSRSGSAARSGPGRASRPCSSRPPGSAPCSPVSATRRVGEAASWSCRPRAVNQTSTSSPGFVPRDRAAEAVVVDAAVLVEALAALHSVVGAVCTGPSLMR